jgi:diguanylate cyclase (GGDEF)-like protein/PAS domain S-box-containing protein
MSRISANRLLNALMANTPDHVYFKDRESRFILVSASLARSFGCKIEDVVGRTDRDFFAELQARAFREAEETLMSTGEAIIDRIVRHSWPDGHVTWSLNVAMPLRDENNEIAGVWGTNKDITKQKLLEQAVADAQRVEYLAYHDALTGLPNRSRFSTLLGESIREARDHERQLAVAFLDLDGFKQINDTLGHEAGDQLLQEVARRLKACVRDSDTVARLGGDEFVVLLPNLEEGQFAATVAQKILTAIGHPFTLLGHEFRITASVGISNYPHDGVDEQTLTKRADIAMYQAKGEGKNTFQFYSEERNANSLERLTLESSLRRALERNEFLLHYQAKREIGSGAVTGAEVLLRWEHPDLGIVAPMQFIPIAEETGLIVPIGKWVLRAACLQNVAWQKQGLASLSIAVNLTPRQFFDAHLVQDVMSILEATGMSPHLLELEITERLLIHDVENTLRVLTKLKALGIRIAIDDFGAGYSSLGSLQRFPLDTIKIGRSFLRDIRRGGQDTALANAIIAMGRALSLTVVAQGVETKEQAAFLHTHACDELQGFYFKRPLPADQFTQVLLDRDADLTYTGARLVSNT